MKTRTLPPRIGRKTKLNKTLLKEIKTAMRAGIFEKYVYQALQIPEATWFYWKNHAKEIEEKILNKEKPRTKTDQKEWPLFLEFLETIRSTKPKITISMIAILQRMAATDFKALKMYLQTVAKEEFGTADTLHLKHSTDKSFAEQMRDASRQMEESEDDSNN